MKRSSDRDTPSHSKRSRLNTGRYDDSLDERITPSPRSREVAERPYSYKVLCVSALPPKASDEIYKARPRSVIPEYERHYFTRSPGPERRLRPVERYERGYGPPGVRRESIPPPHYEYIPRHSIRHGSSHMAPGSSHHYGPSRVHGAFEKVENKRDKFPNYLHHKPPEDDPLATRTLFAGNLEVNITEQKIRGIFGRYGIVEDVDIKKPPPGGTGNAFAFVRFQTLDMAYHAKVELSGRYIGKFQCKIGYGKTTPTTRVWVGGLGHWISIPQLEREFEGFGEIKKIDYAKGDIEAYILYDSIEVAQAAVKGMRGFPLGGSERRLRVDFADVTPPGVTVPPTPAEVRPKVVEYEPYEVTLPEVARKCTTVWRGTLVLKNSLFPAKFHLTDGDTDIVEGLMKDEDGKHQLRITQRLRLEQPKLEDVQKRIATSSSHAIFLGLAGPSTSVTNDDSSVQTRPLRNLVSYFKEKKAAGIISLLNKETAATGVLYSFPPCPFSTELLKRTCPNLSDEGLREDHLVIVVVRGGAGGIA